MVQINVSLEAISSLAKCLGDIKYMLYFRIELRDGVRDRWRGEGAGLCGVHRWITLGRSHHSVFQGRGFVARLSAAEESAGSPGRRRRR